MLSNFTVKSKKSTSSCIFFFHFTLCGVIVLVSLTHLHSILFRTSYFLISFLFSVSLSPLLSTWFLCSTALCYHSSLSSRSYRVTCTPYLSFPILSTWIFSIIYLVRRMSIQSVYYSWSVPFLPLSLIHRIPLAIY